MTKFTIELKLSVSDPAQLTAIADSFQRNFGDRGDDESDAFYVERKAEEYILSLHQNKVAELAQQTVYADTARAVKENATVKERKDKPKPEPKPEEAQTK